MKKTAAFAPLFLLAYFSSPAAAADIPPGAVTQKVLTITNEVIPALVVEAKVVTDEAGNLKGLVFSDAPHFMVTEADLKAGFTTVKQDGRDIIRVIASDYQPNQGATITLDFLRNGARKKEKGRATYSMKLTNQGGAWILTSTSSSNDLLKLHFTKNEYPLVGVVGLNQVLETPMTEGQKQDLLRHAHSERTSKALSEGVSSKDTTPASSAGLAR